MNTNPIVVPFQGTNLYVVAHQGQPYVPMKPVVEGIGLDWRSQASKFRSNKVRWGVAIITTPTNGSDQDAVCLPLRKLPGWLMTLQPSRVAPEVREKVVTYQNECDDALWDYWTKGVAVRPAPDGKLTPAQLKALQDAVQARAELIPVGKRGGAYPKLWGAVKSHFHVPSYRDLTVDQFDAALSLIGRLPLTGEVLPPEAPVAVVPAPTFEFSARETNYDDGVQIVADLRLFAMKFQGSTRENLLLALSSLDRVLVCAWTTMDESMLHAGHVVSMLRRWRGAK